MKSPASPFSFMRDARFHALPVRSLIYCVLGIALSAPAQQAMPVDDPDSSAIVKKPAFTDDWMQHIRIGALIGMNISANFNEKGLFNISGNNAANGIYDDGYVREDQTGNAGGYTGYWGYDSASQYNAAAQTLSMHNATAYSTADNSKDNGSPFPGLEIAYGENLWDWKRIHIGWDAGFGLMPINISDNQPMSATVNQTTYTFDTGGIVMPTAPYRGGPSGQGEPVISATPSSTSSQMLAGTITGTRSLDLILCTFRLGPSFYWDLNKHLSMSLGAGPAVGVVSGEYKYNEIITTGSVSAQNSGSFWGTDVTFGGYVNATLMYHVWDGGPADIFIGAQYMPMTDATFSQAGREGRLNLSGQAYFTVGINWPF